MGEQVNPGSFGNEPIDPDVEPALGDLSLSRGGGLDVLFAIAVGGVLGGVARYEAGLMWPTHPGAFPWTTLGINAVGCGLIGVLIVLITDLPSRWPLARPFFGTGVLGGFTTFSTYAVDGQRLFETGHAGTAAGYLAATLLIALAAVALATTATRRLALHR